MDRTADVSPMPYTHTFINLDRDIRGVKLIPSSSFASRNPVVLPGCFLIVVGPEPATHDAMEAQTTNRSIPGPQESVAGTF